MGIISMKKTNIIILVTLFSFYLNVFGQNTIKLIDGKTIEASSVKFTNTSTTCKINEVEEIAKDQILYVKPEGKTAYTFHFKRNRKYKIAGKDIKNNFDNTDLAKIYAYKYYNSKRDIKELFGMNPNIDLSINDFTKAHNEQEKKIKGRTVTSIILASVAFIAGLGALMSTMNEKKDLEGMSMNIKPGNAIPTLEPENQLPHFKETYFITNFCLSA